MDDNFTETVKTNKPVAPDLLVQAPVSSADPFMFQVFFLAHNQSQSVEVVETDEIDFEEIIQRLKIGESVFIKHKNQEILGFPSRENEEKKHKPWYFTHC
jgi:hypothetical protein